MKRVRLPWLLVLGVAVCLRAAPAAPAAEAPLRVLLLTGQNNHAWKETTPELKKILTSSGRFTVEVCEHPEALGAGALDACDVVLSNWNWLGPVKQWPSPFRTALVQFVRAGHGFVVVHAGGTMFYDWPEFQQLIGGTWGPGTGHGARHTFEVKNLDPQHPITQGLAPFTTTDELWHRMVLQKGYRVLATAFSAKQRGGVGEDQPMVLVTQFGSGRGFTLVLGHDVTAMENLGFQSLLLRGTEWAATGRVTIPPQTRLAAPPVDELLQSVRNYTFGQPRADLVTLQQAVGAASGDAAQAQALAAKFAALLEAPIATPDARRFACQQLGLIGGDAEVPVLKRRLDDAELGLAARFALERIPGDASRTALREAYNSASGKSRIGLIQSLAARGDRCSVPALATDVSKQDRDLAAAAITALGRIGGADAIDALSAAQSSVPATLRPLLDTALLHAAGDARAAGLGPKARDVFAKLLAADNPPPVRIAAFLALVNMDADAGPRLLTAIGGDDATLQTAAARAMQDCLPEAIAGPLVEQLPKLPPLIRAQVLGALARQQVRAALPAALATLSDPDPDLRRAAVVAVGAVGDASAVEPLLKLLETGEDADFQKPFLESLARLRGAGVDDALRAALANTPPAVQREVIRVLATRNAQGAVAALIAAAHSRDAGVRQEAAAALGKLASADDALRLIAELDQLPDPAGIQSAVAAIFRRTGDAGPLLASLAKGSPAQKTVLLGVLTALGGEPARKATLGALKDADADVRLAAVRALAAWPDASALADLLQLAAASEEAKVKILALRGIARLAAADKQSPVAARVAALQQALPLAARPEEKQLLIAALGGIPSPEAGQAAVALLKNPEYRSAAALAVVRIAETIDPQHRAQLDSALKQVRAACDDPQVLLRLGIPLGPNLALGATATSLDGLQPDGQGGPAQAAIDGNSKTYWDETDNQKLYWLRVQFKRPETVAVLRIQGFHHHDYAPKDFEVLCDGKVVKRVSGAVYENNWLVVGLPATHCSTLELKITGYYSRSPAIRELEIYGKTP